MAGQCWACRRQARGLGHSDNRFKVGQSRRYPMDWVFCSRRCQDAFHALYGQWLRTDPRQEDVLMVDSSEFERAAMRACLKCFGEAAGEIGFDKPLGHYSEAEALQVIEAIVTGWTEAMAVTTSRRNIRRCAASNPMRRRHHSRWPCWNRPRHRPLIRPIRLRISRMTCRGKLGSRWWPRALGVGGRSDVGLQFHFDLP